MRCVLRYFLPCLIVFLLPWLHAQSSADLATLEDLKTAAFQMRLEAPGAAAFQLEAEVETYGPDHKASSPVQWKESFTQPDHVDRTVSAGAASNSSASSISSPVSTNGTFLQRYLINAMLFPGPTSADIADSVLSFKTQTSGGVTLRCVTLTSKVKLPASGQPARPDQVYCMSEKVPVIRLVQPGYGMLITYNGLTRFAGRIYAKEIALQNLTGDLGRLRIDRLTEKPEAASSEATPASTPSLSAPHALGEGVTGGVAILKTMPEYPLQSKLRHISGTVYLGVVVSKGGTVLSADVISSPAEDLSGSAMQAVKRWQFQPFLLNGVPVEMDTVIQMNFATGL